MRRYLSLVAVAMVFYSKPVIAQKDSTTHISGAWIAPTVVAGAVVLDGEVREWALREHSAPLDRIARGVNPLGTGRVLIPAMALTYIGARIAHDETLSQGTLKTAAAYAVADIAESALKPALGRERPHVNGNSRRFHPFTMNGDWHSLPSAHVAHITAIVAAISAQTDSRLLNVAGDGLVALVSLDRIYEDQHWSSDVAFTVALTEMLSHATLGFIDSHWGSGR